MTQALARIDVQTLALPDGCELLPSNSRYVNRFNLVSGSSGNKYLIAQCKFNPSNGKGGWWACSCPSYIHGRKGAKMCKHLRDLGLPGNHEKFFIGELAVGALAGSVGTRTLKDTDRHSAAKAPLRAVQGGKARRKAVAAAPKAEVSYDHMMTDADRAELRAPAPQPRTDLLGPAPEPKALPAGRLVPTNVSMTGGKIVVEFSADDSAAVFALLAQLSK